MSWEPERDDSIHPNRIDHNEWANNPRKPSATLSQKPAPSVPPAGWSSKTMERLQEVLDDLKMLQVSTALNRKLLADVDALEEDNEKLLEALADRDQIISKLQDKLFPDKAAQKHAPKVAIANPFIGGFDDNSD